MMAKKLIQWDEEYATAKEKEIAKNANENSGIKMLINQY